VLARRLNLRALFRKLVYHRSQHRLPHGERTPTGEQPMRIRPNCWPLCSAWTLMLLGTASAWGQEPPAPKAQPAILIVQMPAADARLEVEGMLTRQSGPVRRFVSPSLEPGKTYSYTLTAFWKPNNYTDITRTRKVSVQAGKETKVDLRTKDPAQPDNIVIRWVPTPRTVVKAMLELAGAGKDDVVYDLGCGDGRIVIAAVKDFKAKKAVGFDLDPDKIKESKANAKEAGVEDKVDFRLENVLKIKDFSPASVVTLYMSDELNEGVRPALEKTLKPGSRIVSHRFLMGDWKPDKTVSLTVKNDEGLDEEVRIHLWTIGKK
jgi:uncharacterized protein (TIGR03000 family)